MAQNLASKFSKKTSDVLKRKTVIGGITNNNYDLVGVDTVKLYTIVTQPLNDYDRNGSGDRYGESKEVQKTIQTWQLEQDRALNMRIDRLNHEQSMSVTDAGKVLALEIKEQVVPEVDTYVLGVIAAAGATYNRDDIVADAATTKDNAYTNFLDIHANMIDNEGDESGHAAVMTASYYNFLKQSGFIVSSDAAYADRKSGDLGMVDNCKVVIAPSSRMPSNTDLIITHKNATTFADVLTDYTPHKNPVGTSGWKIEGRIAYDAFVDINQIYNIGMHKTA